MMMTMMMMIVTPRDRRKKQRRPGMRGKHLTILTASARIECLRHEMELAVKAL
jgi:hypothetical protein